MMRETEKWPGAGSERGSRIRVEISAARRTALGAPHSLPFGACTRPQLTSRISRRPGDRLLEGTAGSHVFKSGQNMPARVEFKFGNLTRADGSSLLACGDIAVQAAVVGPGEISQSRECPDGGVVDVSLKCLSKKCDSEKRDEEEFIRSVFTSAICTDLYPRSLIQLIVQELTCESLLAAAINCLTAALIDSGLHMKFAVIAVTCVICEDGRVCVGLSEESLITPKTSPVMACGVLAFDSVNLHLLSFCMKGKQISLDKVNQCVKEGRQVAGDILGDLRSGVCHLLGGQ